MGSAPAVASPDTARLGNLEKRDDVGGLASKGSRPARRAAFFLESLSWSLVRSGGNRVAAQRLAGPARANVVGVSTRGRQRRRADPAELLRSPLFSRNSQDALRVMERLAAASLRRPRAGRSLQGVAEETGLALPTLTQLVSFLRRAGLVSQRGRVGTLRLTRGASEISVLDVIRAIDGSGLWRRCLLGLAECLDADPCPVHAAWKTARRQLEEHLGHESMANVARAASRRRRGRR